MLSTFNLPGKNIPNDKQMAMMRTYLAELKDEIEKELYNVKWENLSKPLQEKIESLEKYQSDSDEQFSAIRANYVQAEYLSANYLTASQIAANYATFGYVSANYADIGSLNAVSAAVNSLSAIAITTQNLSAQTISASQISGGTISGNLVRGGTISGVTLTNGGNWSVSSSGYMTYGGAQCVWDGCDVMFADGSTGHINYLSHW